MVYHQGHNQLTVKRMYNVGTVEEVFPIKMAHVQQKGNFVTIVKNKIIS